MSEIQRERPGIFQSSYWKRAAACSADLRFIIFAALIAALRVAVKSLKIPLAPGIYLTFDCYFNALGSAVYGPLLALLVGAVSDTVGAILFPTGPYFFPFILVEMSSSFLFALFLWEKRITPGRVLLSKFTVNFVCNILLNSFLMKWYYAVFYSDKVYRLFNLVRVVKNLVTFPLEAMLIVAVLSAFLPVLHSLRLLRSGEKIPLTRRHVIFTLGLTLLSVGLILFYIFFLKDYLAAHNIQLL